MVIGHDIAHFGFRFTIDGEFDLWLRYLDAPCRIRGHQKPHDVTFLVLSLLTLSVVRKDHEEKSRTGYIRVVFWSVATVAVLMNKGSGRQAWSRPSTTVPLYFLPSSRCVWVCGLVWPWVLTIARRRFLLCLLVHSWWTVMSELVPSS